MADTVSIPTPRWAVPLLAPARYKGAHGGRGSGKSHERAEALIERCLMAKTDAVCIREVQKSLAQSVKKLIEMKIEAMGVGHLFDIQQAVIKAPHGGIIIFQGMQNHTADSIKSLEGYDIAWVEEAQSLSQRSLDLLRPTMRKPGSELWFTWNPRFAKDPIDALLRGDNPPPGAIVVQANYRDNPWLPDVLRDEMEYDKRRDPDKYAHVWLGEYQRNSEARIFHNWRIAEADDACWLVPEGAVLRFGADWGFAIDPTVLIRGWLDARTLYIDHEAYAVGCPIDQTPALFAGDDRRDPPRWPNPKGYAGIPGAYRWPIVADSARPETIDYMAARGFAITPAIKGAGSVEDGVEFLKSVDIVVHPRCRHTIDELTFFSWKVDKQTEEVLPVLADKDNHVIDALRYALEGVRRSAGVFEVATAAPRPDFDMWQPRAYEPANQGGGMWLR